MKTDIAGVVDLLETSHEDRNMALSFCCYGLSLGIRQKRTRKEESR
jgi:hypothetical protein